MILNIFLQQKVNQNYKGQFQLSLQLVQSLFFNRIKNKYINKFDSNKYINRLDQIPLIRKLSLFIKSNFDHLKQQQVNIMNSIQSHLSEQVSQNLKSLNQNKIRKQISQNPQIPDAINQPNQINAIKSANPGKLILKRISLPIKQFQFTQPSTRLRRKTKSELKLRSQNNFNKVMQNIKFENIPIKIVKDKIMFQQFARSQVNMMKFSRKINVEEIDIQNPQGLQIQQQDFAYQIQQSRVLKKSFKELLQIKQRLYKPKSSIFDRYNYENYENYNYKNPFAKHKHESLIKKNLINNNLFNFPKNSKYKLYQGQNKNLQIIFCETKYQDFVKKTNQVFQKNESNLKNQTLMKNSLNLQSKIRNQANQDTHSSQTDKRIKKNKQSFAQYQNKSSHRLSNSKSITQLSYSNYNHKPAPTTNLPQKTLQSLTSRSPNNKQPSKSTLQKHLQQFKALQKISQYQQDQKYSLGKKQNRKEMEEFSRTVLLGLVVSKFMFLTSLSRSFRNHLFRTLFQLDLVEQNTKINIHEYLRFYSIFIYRDATSQELSNFVYRLLKKNQKILNFNSSRNILQQIGSQNKNKLQEAIQILSQLFDQIDQNSQTISKNSHKNIYWLHLVIDLILGQ